MDLRQQLVRVLGAAIVLIAAYLMPAAAQAHEGHFHAASAAVAAATSATPDILAAAAKADPADAVVKTVAVLRTDRPTQAPARCNGFCCGVNMSCCAPTLAPEAATLVPRPAPSRLVLIYQAPARPGIDPEALPKPPRSFA